MMSADPVPSLTITLQPAGPDASTLEHALALGRSGFRVLAVHAPSGSGCTCGIAHDDRKAIGKHPVAKSWQKTATGDEQALRDMFAALKFSPNLGIVLGEQPGGAYLVAIDVDDAERFDALVAKFGELPETLESISARGQRLIFRLSDDVPRDRVKNVTGLDGAPGVDVKARNGQIVVAPSLHASGVRYAWGECLTVAELPAEWTQAILAPPVRPDWVSTYTPSTMREDRHAAKRARRYLESAVLSEASLVYRAREGTRNSTFHLALCRCLPVAHGLMLLDGHAYVVRELSSAARGAGLSPREVHSTVQSAERWLRETNAIRLMPHEPTPAPAPVVVVDGETIEAPEAPEEPPAPERQAIELIQDKGSNAAIAENVARMLAHYPRGAPRYNAFSCQACWPDGSQVIDSDAIAVQSWLYQQPEVERVRASVETIHHGLIHAARQREFHPVRAYLDGLSWDGEERIGQLFTRYFGAPDRPFESAAGVCFLLGAVARVYEPGAKVDTLPVLEGKQGLGKSTALKILAGSWFADSVIPQQEPNCYQVLRGAWIYELSELAAMRGREVERTKAYVTSRVDRYRTSYGRTVEDVPRQTVFAGTTNARQYLGDETGGRRFHPVHCERIDLEALARDRDQLWAEAVHRYREGEAWHLSDELAAAQALVAEQRRHEDPWESIIACVTQGAVDRLPVDVAERASSLLTPLLTSSALPNLSQPPPGVPTWTAHEWLQVIGIESGRQSRTDEMRLSVLLQKCGWKRHRTSDGGVRRWVYRLEVGTDD